MKRQPGISKVAPTTTLETYGRLMDLSDAVGGILIAALSDGHELSLPTGAVERLREARQALMAAHREVEAALVPAARR